MTDSNLNCVETDATKVTAFMSRVYSWMLVGVLLTAIMAYLTELYFPDLIDYLRNNPSQVTTVKNIFMGLIFFEIGLVLVLSSLVQKLSPLVATFLYLFYAALTGVTLASVLYINTHQDISAAFFITVGAFAGLSAYGYFTKRDLNFLGTFCTMGLFGMLGICLYGLFVPSFFSDTIQLTIGAVGVIVFSGLTAYDTKKIKAIALSAMDNDHIKKAAIIGALMLYLDFINLFLSILRLLKGRR